MEHWITECCKEEKGALRIFSPLRCSVGACCRAGWLVRGMLQDFSRRGKWLMCHHFPCGDFVKILFFFIQNVIIVCREIVWNILIIVIFKNYVFHIHHSRETETCSMCIASLHRVPDATLHKCGVTGVDKY